MKKVRNRIASGVTGSVIGQNSHPYRSGLLTLKERRIVARGVPRTVPASVHHPSVNVRNAFGSAMLCQIPISGGANVAVPGDFGVATLTLLVAGLKYQNNTKMVVLVNGPW